MFQSAHISLKTSSSFKFDFFSELSLSERIDSGPNVISISPACDAQCGQSYEELSGIENTLGIIFDVCWMVNAKIQLILLGFSYHAKTRWSLCHNKVCFQADHKLDHKGLWFRADHSLNHLWFQVDNGKIIEKNCLTCMVPCMIRVWSTWSSNPGNHILLI